MSGRICLILIIAIGCHCPRFVSAQAKPAQKISPADLFKLASPAIVRVYRYDVQGVVFVSWLDATAFCRWLSKREGVTCRLPTEAEWEYACRAGTSTSYHSGNAVDDLKRAAWFNQRSSFFNFRNDNANAGTQPVGSNIPNSWGLYDMHGNVREWTADLFGEYSTASVADPQGAENGNRRVHRGGSWIGKAGRCRSAHRDSGEPTAGFPHVGFRVVLEGD